MPITPAQVRMNFRNITVMLDPPNTPVQISITRYACQHRGYGTGQAERIAYKDRLLIATRRDRLGLTGPQFVDVFTGKGTTENIAKCLRLAARHHMYFHEGPAAGPRPGLSLKDGVQRVAHEYIGLDCNGFVGNWAAAAGVPGAYPNRSISTWLGVASAVRNDLSEIMPFDMIIWTNLCHIAVVNDTMRPVPGATERVIDVVESSTGGIQPHKYHVRKVRSSGPGQGPNNMTRFIISTDIHPRAEVFIVQPPGIR